MLLKEVLYVDEKQILDLFEKVLDEKLQHLGEKTSHVGNKKEQEVSTIDGKIASMDERNSYYIDILFEYSRNKILVLLRVTVKWANKQIAFMFSVYLETHIFYCFLFR